MWQTLMNRLYTQSLFFASIPPRRGIFDLPLSSPNSDLRLADPSKLFRSRARLGKSVSKFWRYSEVHPFMNTLGNSANIAANDVAGNFSLTLIDVLDTLVVLNDREGFEAAVKNVIQWVSFDVNTKPQVFETTIRVLGGLLSGHIFANESGPFHLPWYRGELLDMAHDLGKRLLPAFSTPTGIPFARVRCSILHQSPP